MRERARDYFKKQLAALVKISVQQIDDSAPLQDYGFDSIMAIRFTNVLEDAFGPLSKTLLSAPVFFRTVQRVPTRSRQ